MRIVFVLPTVDMSGGLRVVTIYAKLLAAAGHDVRLVYPPLPDIPMRRKIKSLLSGRGWPVYSPKRKSHLDGSGLNFHVLNRYRPVTDGDVPDAEVVVATWWETAEWVHALAPGKGAKVYFVQHHEIFPYLPLERCEATYRLPLHKIVIARWLKNIMRDQYGDHVVDLVPNSVDKKQFHADVRGKQPKPTVGFLYSTTAFKGVKITLAALSLVRQRLPDLRLISFGSEPVSAALPLPECAEFICSPRQDHIKNLYAQCDVWLTSSTSEGFNLPAMEAMACRTPVVSTRTGWPEETISNGYNGMLAGIDDIDGLAKGVHAILSLSDSQWKEMSQHAYETACSGSWEESARQFEAALMHARRRSKTGEIAGDGRYDPHSLG